ncbi:MAG: hypothetical protein AAFU57_15545, partial [Bacteroidota bacterium]
MLGKLLFYAQWFHHNLNPKYTSKKLFRRQFLVLLTICSFGQLSAQQLDTWFTADRAVNSIPAPTPPDPSELHLFTPYAPLDGTPVTTWYDFVDFTAQDAVPHPPMANYPLAPPSGFNYENDGSGSHFSPTGSIPGIPTLRRNIFNFNPALHFDADPNNDGVNNGPGQALHFRSVSRNETAIFIVFQARGQGNSAETQRLLFGGDIENHLPSLTANNLSIGVSDGDFFSIGRTRIAGGSFFQPGNVDLQARPTIGVFNREVLNAGNETLTTRVNGIDDIYWERGGITD